MRVLRIASRVVVSVWIVALAASLAPRLLGPVPAEAPRARLQAVAVEPPSESETRPEPEPAPAPEPAKPAPPPPRAAQVIAPGDLARGDTLLSGKGRFPVISASYEGLQSFYRYATAMTSLGARFVVVRQRQIVGEIELPSGTIREPRLDRPFSPRARDYSDEPALSGPAGRVRERFGPEAEIMLLVPRALDAGLFGGIARELSALGEAHSEFREIQGRYESAPGGGLRFRLLSGLRMDGRRVTLGALFDLSALSTGVSG